VQAVVVIAAFAGAPSSVAGAVLVVSVLLSFWGWGHMQAELALNPDLDEARRARWRMLLACVPGAIALYWLLHVRPDER
jgi:hypothetical protein